MADYSHDKVNESAIVAEMFRSDEVLRTLARDLKPSWFEDENVRVVFYALARLRNSRAPATRAALEDLLKGEVNREDLDAILGRPRTLTIEEHVERLKHDHAKREIARDLLDPLGEAVMDPTAPLSAVERLARRIASRAAADSVASQSGVEVHGALLTELTKRLKGSQLERTGFTLLDELVPQGLLPGTLSLVVARPGHGKSTWLANLLRNRTDLGKSTYVCAWEMEPIEYLEQVASAESGVLAHTLRTAPGQIRPEQKEKINSYLAQAVKLLDFEANPFPSLPKPKDRWAKLNDRNVDHFEATIERASAKHLLVAVDVVGMLFATREPDSISDALVRMRGMAKRYGVHLMLLHHLNRAGAEGPPTVEHIKSSGAFEEVADLILGLDRPIVRASTAQARKMSDVLDVYVLKNRRGVSRGCVRYAFDGSRYRLSQEESIDLALLEKQREEGVE